MSEPVLQTVDLKRSFTQGEHKIEVLRGVNLTIMPGEIVALLGPSGSGKSTLLQAVGLLEGGFEGSIRIAGREVARIAQQEERRRFDFLHPVRNFRRAALARAEDTMRTRIRREQLSFIYQFHHLLPDFNALENVVLPQMIHGTAREQGDQRSAELLTALGLGQRLTHRPNQLSGGEQQRVAVARALATRPMLVLADEPTGNLDEVTANTVFAEFLNLVRGEGSSALVATHNERLAARMDRVVRLQDGVLE